MNGKIKWINIEKGFGFITSDSGVDVFVHNREIDKEAGELKEGEAVVFDYIENDMGRGPYAKNVKKGQ